MGILLLFLSACQLQRTGPRGQVPASTHPSMARLFTLLQYRGDVLVWQNRQYRSGSTRQPTPELICPNPEIAAVDLQLEKSRPELSTSLRAALQ